MRPVDTIVDESPGGSAAEIAAGERFEFGENWRRFLSVLDEERIAEAERSLRPMLGVERPARAHASSTSAAAAACSRSPRVASAPSACTRSTSTPARVAARRVAPPLRRGRGWTVERGSSSTRCTSPGSAGSTSCTRGACCTTPATVGRAGQRRRPGRARWSPVRLDLQRPGLAQPHLAAVKRRYNRCRPRLSGPSGRRVAPREHCRSATRPPAASSGTTCLLDPVPPPAA